jgi:Family of unknown function (DUF5670)
MLEAIAAVLFVLWVTGLGLSYTMGGFIHILLITAVVVTLIREQKLLASSAAPEGDELTALNIFGGALVATSILSLVFGGVSVPVWAVVGALVLGGLLLLVPKKGWTSALALREAPHGIVLHSRRDRAPGEVE